MNRYLRCHHKSHDILLTLQLNRFSNCVVKMLHIFGENKQWEYLLFYTEKSAHKDILETNFSRVHILFF